jgi:hypothetical protein
MIPQRIDEVQRQRDIDDKNREARINKARETAEEENKESAPEKPAKKEKKSDD